MGVVLGHADGGSVREQLEEAQIHRFDGGGQRNTGHARGLFGGGVEVGEVGVVVGVSGVCGVGAFDAFGSLRGGFGVGCVGAGCLVVSYRVSGRPGKLRIRDPPPQGSDLRNFVRVRTRDDLGGHGQCALRRRAGPASQRNSVRRIGVHRVHQPVIGDGGIDVFTVQLHLGAQDVGAVHIGSARDDGKSGLLRVGAIADGRAVGACGGCVGVRVGCVGVRVGCGVVGGRGVGGIGIGAGVTRALGRSFRFAIGRLIAFARLRGVLLDVHRIGDDIGPVGTVRGCLVGRGRSLSRRGLIDVY